MLNLAAICMKNVRACNNANYWASGSVMYLIVGQELWTQDPIFGIVWLCICEHMEGDGSNIRGADEWDLAIFTCGIDLTLIFDGDLM